MTSSRLAMFCTIFLLTASWGASAIGEESNSFQSCLSELRISELLRLKKSLERINLTEEVSENRYVDPTMITDKCDDKVQGNCESQPTAMALTADERGYNYNPHPVEYHPPYYPYLPEEKPSKLQTLFQISITALSFLSFGGYLLCLIVQAIKSKGTTYYHPVTTAAPNGKRIKVYRRSRRSWNPNGSYENFYNYLHTIYGY